MGSCSSNQRQSSAKEKSVITDYVLYGGCNSCRSSKSSIVVKPQPSKHRRNLKKVLHNRPRLVTICAENGQSATCSSTNESATPPTDEISSPSVSSQPARKPLSAPLQAQSSRNFLPPHRSQQQQDLPNDNQPTRAFRQDYQIAHQAAELGSGVAGHVRECMHRATSLPRAVKVVDKSRIERKDRVRREIALLRKVRHPNIIRLYDAYEDEDEVRIVTELCRGGELFERIAEKAAASERGSEPGGDLGRMPACFREEDAARIVRMLVLAVSHLHSRDIVHRDIKPENILFTEKNDDDQSPIKLIDFGLSIEHRPDEPPLTSAVGTVYYMAPELLDGCYDRSCDMWSIGVIAYTMLSGRPPFNGLTNDVIFEKIRRGRFQMEGSGPWNNGRVSNHAKDFIRRLLDMDTSRRWTADMALGHPWLNRFLLPSLKMAGGV